MQGLKQLLKVGWVVLIVAAVAALNFILISPSRDERAVFNITCDLKARPGQVPIRLGQYSGPLEAISFEGTLSDRSGELYRFDGRSRFRIEGQELSADARGSVFIFTTSQVDAFMFTVEADGFGRGGLSVVTLNDEGRLDENSNTAYAWTSKVFRLSHPMDIDCALSDPEPTLWEQMGL
ncbi:MAG: hypothetical protein AAFQ13_00050 [Pseudomonadota bacterium]